MPLPLPNIIPDFGPGGPVADAFARSQGIANQLMQNYFLPKTTQAELANKNALTKSTEIANQFSPERLRLANENQALINKYYGPNIQSEMALRGAQIPQINAQTNRLTQMTPYDVSLAKQQADWYGRQEQAKIDQMKALASFRNMGGGGMGVGQKELIGLKNQLSMDNPTYSPDQINEAANNVLNGSNNLDNGAPVKVGGQASSIVSQIFKRNSTATIQNTAANSDITAQDINNIDISPVAKFAGLKGKINFLSERAKMLTNPDSVSEDFRNYKSFQDEVSILAMDTLRKGFQTSVVPDYVSITLGKAVNPQSDWWNDPKQVIKDWNKLKEWVNNNAKMWNKKATGGATAQLMPENKSNQSTNPKTEASQGAWILKNGKVVRG